MKCKPSYLLIICLFISIQQTAQSHLSCEELLKMAEKNNLFIQEGKIRIAERAKLASNTLELDKTEIYFGYDENNLALNNIPLSVFGVVQDFKFPSYYSANKLVKEIEFDIEKSNLEILKNKIYEQITSLYHQILYEKNRLKLFMFLEESFYSHQGKENDQNNIMHQLKKRHLNTQISKSKQDISSLKNQMEALVKEEGIAIENKPLHKILLKSSKKNDPNIIYLEQLEKLQNAIFKKERREFLPEFSFEYFQGSNRALNDQIMGLQIGMKIPLLFYRKQTKIEVLRIQRQQHSIKQLQLKDHYVLQKKSLQKLLKNYEADIKYYEVEGKKLKEKVVKEAFQKFQKGQFSFDEYFEHLEISVQLELDYLEALNNYNQTINQLNYQILNI